MPEQSEMEKRIQELEAEVSNLRKSKHGKYSAAEDTFKGTPVIVIETPSGRKYSFGAAKLLAIKNCWSSVEKFLSKHRPDSKVSATNDIGDDGKI